VEEVAPGLRRDADLRATLAPLLELPVELVLTAHGEPVLSGGRETLTKVLR
jgi:hypothetical protein